MSLLTDRKGGSAMESAKELIEILEDLGYSVSDIVELSGVSQPSISLIKSGQQSGKTSRPRLQRMLDAAEAQERPPTRSYAPPPGHSHVIDATFTVEDAPNTRPATRVEPTRALQPYHASIPQEELDARGYVYRQSRNRYGVTPDALMQEIQGLRLEIHELRQEQNQQLKQQVREVHRADTASDPYLAFMTSAAYLTKQLYDAHQERKSAERQLQPIGTRAQRRQQEPQPQPIATPSYHITPRLQPTRPAMFGRSAFEQRAHEPQPRRSLWQKIKENW